MPIRGATLITALLCARLAAAGVPTPEASAGAVDETAVIAVFADGTVTAGRYASWLRFRSLEHDRATRARELEQLVLASRLAELAREGGLHRAPRTRQALEMVTARVLTAEVRRRRAQAIEISDEAVDAALEREPQAFQKPERVRLRTLFKRFADDADREAREATHRVLEDLRERLLEGAEFTKLAGAESDSQARFRDGLIGNVEPGELPAEIDRIAFALQPGEVSEIVETRGGLSLFYCEARLPGRTRPPEEVRQLVAGSLRNFEVKRDWEAYRASLIERAGLRFEDEGGDLLARYEEGEVSWRDLTEWRRTVGAPLPDQPRTHVVHDTVRQIVFARLAAGDARALGFDRDPEVVERLAWEEVVLLGTMELARRVDELVKAPSEAETREYFEAQGHRFVRRQHYDLSVILIEATSEGLPAAYDRALSLREELAAGTIEFEAAARAHSDHPSRADGGRLGPVERPRLAALGRNVFNTIIALEPGAVGRLVQRDLQLWIVKLHEIQPARPLTFEEAREAVEQALGDERTQTIREAVEEELLRELSLELVG